MRKNKLRKFKILKISGLDHGVLDKNFGNIDFEYGMRKAVLKNREKISKLFKISLSNLYEMDQVHGSEVKILRNLDIKKLREEKINIIKDTDGLITDQINVFLMIKTADCFPVLMFDPVQKVIAAIHAGWRGAIEKIFLNALLKMVDKFDSKPQNVLVAVGPGIRRCCFKHTKLIQEKLPEWRKYIKKERVNLLSLDLPEFIKDQLISAGVKKKHLEDMNICSNCSKTPNNKYSGQDFFSHFRSLKAGEAEGRFATIIGLNND